MKVLQGLVGGALGLAGGLLVAVLATGHIGDAMAATQSPEPPTVIVQLPAEIVGG